MAAPWEKYQTEGAKPWEKYAPAQEATPQEQTAPDAPPEHGLANNIAQGAIRGAAGIGTTILWPVDALKDMVSPKQRTLADVVAGTRPMSSHEERKSKIDDVMREVADVDSLGFKGGKLGAEIAGTAGVGGGLGAGAKALGLTKYAPALESGGFTLGNELGGASNLARVLARLGSGAAVGGASSALINPESAGTGALLGAALPGAAAAGGMAGKALGLGVSPEVAALAEKAKAMGIEIPADRLTDSKFMNAVASSLNYLPLSGRAGTEARMLSQLNRAASRTMGEDTGNLAKALRDAKTNLGQKFDDTLKGTNVVVDDTLLADMTKIQEQAARELTPDQAKIISNQVDDILGMANDGVIEGQAAYNLKRNLDRIAKRNSPEGHWGKELRNSLVDGLNRSLGDERAQAFQQVRQQYGNMKALGRFAANGAEGELTAAKLGGMKDIRSGDLQDVADVAAQFVKGRESPHGAMQRIVLGAVGSAASPLGLAPYVAGGMAAGRMGNMAFNSDFLKSALTDPNKLAAALGRRAELRAIPSVLAAE